MVNFPPSAPGLWCSRCLQPFSASRESIAVMSPAGFTRRATGVRAWLALSASFVALAPSSPQQGPIKVEVELVNVLASVVDKNNRPVGDLTKDDFQIYDEGRLQTITVFESETHQPLDLALMFDASMSTALDFDAERDAAVRFIHNVVRPGDGLAFFTFSDDVTERVDFTDNIPRLQQAITKVKEGAGTALYDAVVLGSQELGNRKFDRRRVIIMLTDAGETTSHSSFETARNAAIHAGALLYTIVLNPVKNENGRNTAGEHALATITETTGGAMFYPQQASELDGIFTRINRELRTQYRLGFYPDPKPPAGELRHLEVRVKGDYIIRARQAYIAPGPKGKSN
jgi:Ca-activated chloride channel homolog